jgi:hypothetical protein
LKAIEVKVFDNDLEKAMRILKKKIQPTARSILVIPTRQLGVAMPTCAYTECLDSMYRMRRFGIILGLVDHHQYP